MFEEVCLVCGKHLQDDGYVSFSLITLCPHLLLAKLIAVKIARTSTLLLPLFLLPAAFFHLLT